MNLTQELKKLAMAGEKSFLAGAQWRVLHALEQLNNENPLLIYQILHPSRLLEVELPVKFKGKTYLCLGFRAWFSPIKLNQPGQIVKGGIRFLSLPGQNDGPVVSVTDENYARKLAFDDVMALGLEMLAKNSGTDFKKNVLKKFGLAKLHKLIENLDIRGGAKGVIVAPRSLHEPDHNEFVSEALKVFGYQLGLNNIVGWDRDVPAGDIGTTGTVSGNSVLDSFVDGYWQSVKDMGLKMPKNLIVAAATGKTANKKYSGTPARATATGFGTVAALKAWTESKKMDLADLTVVFDGAGNAALPAAKLLANTGIKVVGMADSRSVVLVNKGFTKQDLEKIGQIKLKRGSLSDWAKDNKEAKILKDKAELWKLSGMNVLFVSSDAMIINSANVDLLPKGLLIVDGANGPVTPLAEMKLPGLKIDHLTGSFANSGGVICSLVEWAANVGNFQVSKENAEEYVSYSIRENFRQMKLLVDKSVVSSLADAFYYMAMERYIKNWMS